MGLVIKVINAYKSFPKDFEAYIDSDLALISGVNGSGKTQLIDIIKGYPFNSVYESINRTLTLDGNVIENDVIVSKSFREYQGLSELTTAVVGTTTSARNQIYQWYIDANLEFHQHNQIVPINMRGSAKTAKELLINKFGKDKFYAKQLTRDDIKTGIPADFILYEDDIFSNKIGELFFNHVSLIYKKKAEAGEKGEKFNIMELPPAPWIILNNLFDKLKFNYRFLDDYKRVDDEIDTQPAIYELNENRIKDQSKKRNLNDLSDGEKALISLSFAVIASDQKKPKLLLLDEYDATFNPSLIESFFTIIQDYFVSQGVKVIIVTHSPATLSLAPPNASFYELYRPNSSGLRLMSINRDQYEELSIANRNFYSQIADQKSRLEQLKIDNDELSRLVESLKNSTKKLQIITEGNNIDHIEQAIKILQPDLLEQIEFVRGAERVTGKNQMKPAFEIMANLTSEHKVIFIWDVDAKSMVVELTETDTCKKFCFLSNSANDRIPAGIENIYPVDFITDDLYSKKETPRNDGGKNIQIELNKKALLNKVKSETKIEIFENYKPLIKLLNDFSLS